MAGVDPYTGEPIPDDGSQGVSLDWNPFKNLTWGGGAKPAAPMRGAYPNFPPLGPGRDTGQAPSYTGPPSGNGFAAGGAGGSLQGNGGQPFQIPNNGFGAAGATPMQRPNFATPNEIMRSRAYGGDPAGNPDPGGITTSDPGSGVTDPGLFGGNAPAPDTQGPSVWDRIKSAFGGAYDNIHGAMPGSDPSLPPYGAARPDAPWASQAPASGRGGIGSDANFPLTGGAARHGMPWPAMADTCRWRANAECPGPVITAASPRLLAECPGLATMAAGLGGQGAPAGRAPPMVNLGNGAPGVAAPHPAVQAAVARAAAAQQAGQSPSSPFTMVMRPNASAQNGNAYPGSMNTGPRRRRNAVGDCARSQSYAAAVVNQRPLPHLSALRRAQGSRARSASQDGAETSGRGRPVPAPAPYPVTDSGSPTPLSAQHGGAIPPTTPHPHAWLRCGHDLLSK